MKRPARSAANKARDEPRSWLVIESLVAWAAEVGLALRPHGLDFVPELVIATRIVVAGRTAAPGVAAVWIHRPESAA